MSTHAFGGGASRALNGPDGYALGRDTLDELERQSVAPLPLHYELWAHALGRPESALAKRLQELLAARTPISEALSQSLAAEHLPQHRKSALIDQASGVIDVQLQEMASALGDAQTTTSVYGGVLRSAGSALPGITTTDELGRIRDELVAATEESEAQVRRLQQRLEESGHELHKLWTALERANAEARTDPLTGLLNRKAFDERIDSLIAQAFERGDKLGLALLDVDHFKTVNDRWGHQTGDQVLRFIASEIAKAATDPRVCVRYGGEEFAIIFPGVGRLGMHATLETIRSAIWDRQLRRRSTGELLGQLSLSSGYAELRAGDTAETLIARADQALYAAKHQGRNRTVRAPDPAP